MLITIYRRLLEKIALRAIQRIRRTSPPHRSRKTHHPRQRIPEALGVMTQSWTQPPTVAVVGGGLAGLAAGCALAGAGLSRDPARTPALPRRSRLFVPASRNRRDCRQLPARAPWLLHQPHRVLSAHRRGGQDSLVRQPDIPRARRPRLAHRPSSLPAPLHTTPAFLRAACLDFSDKVGIARAMTGARACHSRDNGESFLSWLQPPRSNRSRHRTLLEDRPGQRSQRRYRSDLRALCRPGHARVISEICRRRTHGRAHCSPDRTLQCRGGVHSLPRRHRALPHLAWMLSAPTSPMSR